MLLPWVLPGAISAVLWIWVFHPSFGVINGLLRDLGLIDGSIPWLTSPRLAFVSVVVAHVWTQIPFAVVLIMAALSAINSETLEAAAIDAAARCKRFRYIVFPQIKSMIVVLLVYNALTAFTSYDLVYAMTGGGPGTATTLLVLPDLARELLHVRFRRGIGGRLHRRRHLGSADRRHHARAALRSVRGGVTMRAASIRS